MAIKHGLLGDHRKSRVELGNPSQIHAKSPTRCCWCLLVLLGICIMEEQYGGVRFVMGVPPVIIHFRLGFSDFPWNKAFISGVVSWEAPSGMTWDGWTPMRRWFFSRNLGSSPHECYDFIAINPGQASELTPLRSPTGISCGSQAWSVRKSHEISELNGCFDPKITPWKNHARHWGSSKKPIIEHK